MSTTRKPATPLPYAATEGRSGRWILTHGAHCLPFDSEQDVAYIAHAANAYPRLIAALHQIDNIALSHPYAGNTCGEIARALLAELEAE